MINAINDIGKYLIESGEKSEEDIIKSLVKPINGDSIKEILLIDVTKEGIKTAVEDFYSGIVYKALFFQAGNGIKGGGIRADFYPEMKEGLNETERKKRESEKKKFLSKIDNVTKYCEVNEFKEEIEEIIINRIKNYGSDFFTVILKDGKYPYELFKEKFLNDFYNVDFKKIQGEHICHICGNYGEAFNTVTFKFYTNDKEVYGNINDEQKSGIVICKECLHNIILGKKHMEEYLTAYWMGANVMFVPHYYDEDIDLLYKGANLDSNESKKLLDNISSAEDEVLEAIGKSKSETDIVFFKKEGEKTFYIFHTIKSLLPSRFSFLAKALTNNKKISLYYLINDMASVKYGKKGLEATEKERFKMLDIIFSGNKLNRNLFFSRMIKQIKEEYYSEGKTLNSINKINKYYNFLVDCNCLEGGFDYMKKYKDYTELFENNKDYFISNEKKAWFILGNVYGKLNWKIRQQSKTEEGNMADRTSLDKNFFFARKFNFKDFIYFSNLLDEKMIKYPKINTSYLKEMLSEAKELMASRENKLSADEAKYIFFWGINTFYKKENDGDEDENENREGEM